MGQLQEEEDEEERRFVLKFGLQWTLIYYLWMSRAIFTYPTIKRSRDTY